MEETIEPVAPIRRRPRNLESVQYLARERRLARQQRASRRAEAREAKAEAKKAKAHAQPTGLIPVTEVSVSASDVANWKIGQMNEWVDSLKAASSSVATAYWTHNVSGNAPGLMNALVKSVSSTVTSAQATGETKTLAGVYDPAEWHAADTALSYVNKLNAESQHLKFTSTTNADGSCTVTYEIV